MSLSIIQPSSMRIQNFLSTRSLFTGGCIIILASLFCLQQCKRDTPKTAGQTTTSPAEQAPPEPASEKTLRIRLEGDATVLNPIMPQAGAYGGNVCQQIFQTLGIVDPQSLALKPWMIVSLPKERKVSSGPQKGRFAYDFEILPAATWDNGSPITGHDIAFSLKLIFDPLLPTDRWRGYFDQIRDVEVDAQNPKKCTVFLQDYYILASEALCGLPIYPAYHYDAAGTLAKIPLADFMDTSKTAALKANADLKVFSDAFQSPKFAVEKGGVIGSNAYALESLKPGLGVVLTRKKDWWGDKAVAQNPDLAAYPEKLVYCVVKDEGAAETMLKNGELDVVLTLGVNKFLELKANPSVAQNYDFALRPSLQYSRWMFNTRDPKLKDRRVREALAHIINYTDIIDNVYQGLAQRIISPILPNKPYFNSDLKAYDFDIAKAQSLLKAAGWQDTDGNGVLDKVIDGKKTEFTLGVMVANASQSSRLVSEGLRENAKKVNINIELQSNDLKNISAETKKGNYESALLAATLNTGTDDLYQEFHSESLAPAGDNRTAFANPKADKLLDAIRAEPNVAKRAQYYKQLQQVLHEELPMVFLFNPQQRIVTSKRFEPSLTVTTPGYYAQFFKAKKAQQ